MEEIVIIDYDAGNIRSVQFALERLGKRSMLTKDAGLISSAEKVIFPGVGRADSALGRLQLLGLDEVIKSLKQPVLGICLGMQLMCGSNEEGNITGLNIFDASVKRFSGEGKIPHMGWNALSDGSGSLLEGIAPGDFFYFVHSYFAPVIPATSASCVYLGQAFSAVMESGNFYGCQFHPEKSGLLGERILQNFLNL